MKATYLQGRDEMRGELQQVKDEHPTLANIADAAGSAVSPVNIFSKGNWKQNIWQKLWIFIR